MLNNLLQMHLKLKAAEVTGDFIGNKTADKITTVSKHLPKNSSETVESETKNTKFDRDIPKERCLQKRQQIITVMHEYMLKEL